MSIKATVPTGMSRADALECLWKHSRPSSFLSAVKMDCDDLNFRKQVEYRRATADAWESKEKVEAMIQKSPYIHDFAGRCIATDMSQYPLLDLTSYEEKCGNTMPIEKIFENCLKKSH
jgi:hypothetical protein